MTGPIVRNQVRSGFYLDSVALMRFSREIEAAASVITASMMIGTPSNKALLEDAGLLADEAVGAGPNDLIIVIRGETAEATDNALLFAGETMNRPRRSAGEDGEWTPRALDSAIAMLPDANLVIISVPGAFAAREAHRALRRGLNVMMFSDNVPLEQECALKAEAGELDLLMMGPDCGSAIIGGTPLGFANAVSRGDIGIVAASGTGLQEVSTLDRPQWRRGQPCHWRRRTRFVSAGRRRDHVGGNRRAGCRSGHRADCVDFKTAFAGNR